MNLFEESEETYDCRRLLQYSDAAETAFLASLQNTNRRRKRNEIPFSNHDPYEHPTTNFGHPDPPKLHMLHIYSNNEEKSACFVIAFTQHTIFAEFLERSGTSSTLNAAPMELYTIKPFDDTDDEWKSRESNEEEDITDEKITCLTVVELENLTLLLPPKIMEFNEVMIHAEESDVSPQDTNEKRLAVVFGTSCSHLFTIELKIIYSKQKDDPWSVEVVRIPNLSNKSMKGGPDDDEVFNETSQKIFEKESKKARSDMKTAFRFPFYQSGGISNLYSHQIYSEQYSATYSPLSTYVWIVHVDGTIVRIHHAGLFPSIWYRGVTEEKSVEDLIRSNSIPAVLVRSRLRLPPGVFDSPISIPKAIPLPQYYPSPLTMPFQKLVFDGATGNEQYDDENEESESSDITAEGVDSIAETVMEALVLGQGSPSDLFPTFCFYSSEQQCLLSGHNDIDEPTGNAKSVAESNILGSVAKTLLGSALGALRWGFGNNANANEGTSLDTDGVSVVNTVNYDSQSIRRVDDSTSIRIDNEGIAESSDRRVSFQLFPSLWLPPKEMYASSELHDSPRQIEFCTIDPDGNLAAATDSLGRVLLIDIASKQLIRMWKGLREAECFWHQTVNARYPDRVSLHLVIHSKQRRIVEVWKVRQGGRLISKPVGRDASLVSCRMRSGDSELTKCYILHSTVPGTSANSLEKIGIFDGSTSTSLNNEMASNYATPGTSSASRQTSASSRTATLRLQRLQQLLSSSNVDFCIEDVEEALHEIKSLKDLATALDILAQATMLEERLGISGSSFHQGAVSYCSSVLKDSLWIQGEDSSRICQSTNPFVRFLFHKIEYHTQIVAAFDILNKFESETEKDATYQQKTSLSQWTAESMGWAKTYDQVNRIRSDTVEPSDARGKICSFTKFATSCTFPKLEEGVLASQTKSNLQVYFHDSTRTRREILEHVFRPLVSDLFSFNVVISILECLGIRGDMRYIQMCFGEWFMTLPLEQAFTKGIYSDNPSMVRLLSDLVRLEIDSTTFSEDSVVLEEIHSFCERSEDLIRSFMLGALCLEAIIKIVEQKEKATYGKILSSTVTNAWTTLLRKLRVCLLVSLRLNGKRLAAPITVKDVTQEGLFSVFEWVALDELHMTHNNIEIVSLEKACAMSSYSFDPSLPEGDGPERFKMLQRSCLSAAFTEEERAEYLVDFEDEDRFGALLLFLSNHNVPPFLAAHRALILAAQWSSTPEMTDCLKDTLSTLTGLLEIPGADVLASSICLEIWQTRICPIYRAYLFGFSDVQEVSEDVVSPLLKNREWLNEVGRISLQLLAILKDCKMNVDYGSLFDTFVIYKHDSWPPLRHDAILRRLVEKMRPIDINALDAHVVIICALLLSGDIEPLFQCVPAIYECFASQSLFTPISTNANVRELQKAYIDNAVLSFARNYSGPAMESFDIGEIQTLVDVWHFDLKSVYTLFVLAMYEYGKDRVVDELVTKASSKLLIHRFIESGIDIACRRLNFFLHGRGMHSSGMHDVMGLLDADLCEWIKQRATEGHALVENPEYEIPIGGTHLFILRLLNLSASSSVDASVRVRIHSLIVLSGIVVNAAAATNPSS